MTPSAMSPTTTPEVRQGIRDYYGRVLRSSDHLKTGACCSSEPPDPRIRDLLNELHPEVRERFYGCGIPLPESLEGATVLDLGCGAGRDAFLLSALVGPRGRVIGVDMTPEQLEVATRHRDFHARAFGHPRSNVEFHHGFMEDLAPLGIEDASVDVVVSNCVFNLSPEKPRLFREVFRVLKPGGELHFSDVVADRRVPVALRQDPVLVGECLAGAMYSEDLRRTLAQAGCADMRVTGRSPVDLLDPDIGDRIGMVDFRSVTVRAFRLELEDHCEDYGEVATYLGTVADQPHAFALDEGHRFETGRPKRVCGNTADMLARTRFRTHFRVTGDRSVHFGLFPGCGVPGVGGGADGPPMQAACC